MLPESDIARVVDNILRREGGFSDDPTDRGGRTNFGITQATADEYALGDVAQLTHDKAAAFYRGMLRRTKLDQIPDFATLDLVADCAVNHGESRAIKWLQQALNFFSPAIDGVIGPMTIACMKSTGNWHSPYEAILATRIQFYASILANERNQHPDRTLHDSQVKFISGWISRACEFLAR